MGKSFVFRSERGAPVGYLAQGLHAISCRIRAAETDEVIVFLQDGSYRRRRIEHAGEEMEWREENCGVVGAAALENGRVFAATGDDARRRWSQMICRKGTREAKAEEQTQTKSAGPEYARQDETKKKTEREEERRTDAGVQNAYAWPQRRWPPPPCWRTAVYCHGAWDEEKA